MRRLFRGLVWALGVLYIGFAATPSHADVLFAVRVLRDGGCGGILPGAPPLHRNGVLDRSAAEWAAGRTLTAAMDLSGYHAVSAAGVHVRGPEDAMLQLFRPGCRTLANQSLHEMGLYRRGFDVWIVLATEHEMSAGSTAPAPAKEPPSRSEAHAPPPPHERAQPQAGAAQPELPEDAAIPTPAPDVVARAAPAAPASKRAPVPPKPTPAAPPAALASPPVTAGRAGTAVVAPLPKAPLSPILATRALQLVNEVRARGTRCGSEVFGPAPPVALSATLSGVALGHASDMAQHNYFEHEDLQGKSPSDRVRASGYQEKLVGENIAYGPKTVDEVVQGWLDSPGHCENIMDPRFAEMGMAFAVSQVPKQRYYWVQLLAEPRNLAARR